MYTQPIQKAERILKEFTQQVREWRLDALLYRLLEGEQAAKYQLSWYLHYQIPPKETEDFITAFNALEKADPRNPSIPWIKMIRHLYGIGVKPSVEYSRHHLQEYQHHFATSANAHDPFINELTKLNEQPEFLRLQWFAAHGNGDAVCDLAKYYLEEKQHPDDVRNAIALLKAAADFGHLRALEILAILYREGKHIEPHLDQAQHYARKAFLRKVAMNPSEAWQIRDLPISGYSERLAERDICRTYHETLCMLNPTYDFLFAKESTLVPLVHQPSVRGVLENIKVDPHYFIEHLIHFDIQELHWERLKIALVRLIKYYQPPKIQRDQVRLLLTYIYAQEQKVLETAEYALNIRQPYTYLEVIKKIDPNGELGQFLLSCVNVPERSAQLQNLHEADILLDYALIYLIACIDNLNPKVKQTLYQHLCEKYSTEKDINTLITFHMQYCQARYALFKIQHGIYLRSWWKDYFRRQQSLRQDAARAAWINVLNQLQLEQNIDKEALAIIQKAYPLLTNSLDFLHQAPAIVLKKLSQVSQQLATDLLRANPL